MPLKTTRISTRPFDDQRPGTSGLRKKVARFQADYYLENFVQAVFNAIPANERGLLVVGGDGRYFNQQATQIIIRMATANGFKRVMVGADGILSTPAVSNLIRVHGACGGIVLSASHNPGGPDEDFGIKFNNANGSPAPEAVTDAIYENTRTITEFFTTHGDDIDLTQPGEHVLGETRVEIVDSVTDYTETMQKCFDFNHLRDGFKSGRLSVCFDAMHAVTGPYARRILEDELGAVPASVINARPLEDFGGGHPDPNLVHAHALVNRMAQADAPSLGAASDGDGDRNLILGPGFFVTPSDSLAVLTAHARLIPQFADGLAGVARSMPTSTAVDRVARYLGVDCYETPTGWKFFGNLLDAGRINLCGEESFGTGGDHVREKDGLWTVLAWLTVVSRLNKSVKDVLDQHWNTYGRNFYCRHDFEAIPVDQADSMMDALRNGLIKLAGRQLGDFAVRSAGEFGYSDPVDGSRSENQGVQVHFEDGSRIVFRLSGTGTSGATLRMYVERYSTSGFGQDAISSNQPLAEAGREIIDLTRFTGRDTATVVT